MPKLVASNLNEKEYAEFLSVKISAGPSRANRPKVEESVNEAQAPVKLTFSDISAHVRLPNGETKTIMDGVSGHAQTGQVMALMGPTGSGKTTLLCALGNRMDPSVVVSPSSRISYGGQPWNRSLFLTLPVLT